MKSRFGPWSNGLASEYYSIDINGTAAGRHDFFIEISFWRMPIAITVYIGKCEMWDWEIYMHDL